MSTNEEYWADREAQKQAKLDEITDEDVEMVRKAIDGAIRGLKTSIRDIYRKYAFDNDMDYYTAIQYLNDDERAEFQHDLQYYVEKYKDSEYVKHHKKELHSLSVRARVRRIDTVIAEIKRYASDLEEHLNKDTRQKMDDIYMEGYLRAQYETLEGKAPELNFANAFPYKKVQEILDIPWSGKNYSQKVWDISGDFADKLQSVLTQGLIQGQHPDVIAREFRKAGFGKEQVNKDGTKRRGGIARRAEDLIRTEASYVIEQAQLNAYEELGVERYRYKTEMDGKQCAVCEELNDKYFDLSEAKVGVNYPIMHVGCRCTTKPATIYDDEDESQYDLPYDEWYAQYVQPEIDRIHTEKAKTDMLQQADALDSKEKDVLTRWTGSLSQRINGAINHDLNLSKYETDITLMNKALSKGIIPNDVVLYRATDIRYLKEYTGGKNVTEEAVNALVGKTINNDIYTATSFDKLELGARNTFITLNVPGGTENALYIKDLAYKQFKDQNEVLFGRGLRYKVKEAKIVDGKVYIQAEVLKDD